MSWATAEKRWPPLEAVRRGVQAVRVSRALEPSRVFLWDVVRASPRARYRSRRTGDYVFLRARGDLQVARELISKDAYAPPPEVRRVLGERVSVLDLGANIGLFALAAIHTYGPETRVVAVEPDPSNVPLLIATVEANDLQERVKVLPVLAGVRPGTERFVSGLGHTSHIAADGEHGEQVEVVDVFELPRCDVVKMDIEGGEWPILRDPRLRDLGAKAIALEWHSRGTDHPDPGQEAANLLRDAGYIVGHEERRPPDWGALWAWRWE
jgi:FkbM family methyltransferase